MSPLNPSLLYAIEYFGCWIILICLIPKQYVFVIRLLASLATLSFLFLSLLFWYFFDQSRFGFQFWYQLPIIPEYNLNLSLGLDGISLSFLLLTAFIMPLCVLSSTNVTLNYKQFIIYLLFTQLFLILSFVVTDLFFFYVSFESVLIPMFIIIGSWGSRSRKIKAAYYFFLYTLFGSLIMLFGILYLYTIVESTEYEILFNLVFTQKEQLMLWICFFIPFAIKIPMFPFHIWLPEAHVEAPTIGSVILASLILKLGSYGFLRFTLNMFPMGSEYFLPLVYTLAIISVIYASLSTIRQIDLKRIIAYASVAHMNIMVLGLFSYTHQGIDGAIYLMLAHGVVSSALFFCVGILYDRYHTRLLKYYGGLVQVMPIFSILFFLFTLANMGFPGTCNFVGELLVLSGLFQHNSFVMILAATGIIWSAIYSIWLFNRVIFGTLKTMYISHFIDITAIEYIILIILAIMTIVWGINSTWLTSLVSLNTEYILMATSLKTSNL